MKAGAAAAAACALLCGAAPVPAAAPARAAPVRPQLGPFMFFFDYDSDAIAPDAAAILANVPRAWRTGAAARLVVAGHANTSHSDEESIALSRRRAWRVYDWLVDAGVPPEAIAVHHYGEDRPLVVTGDGVREPQNRRVEIALEPAVTAP